MAVLELNSTSRPSADRNRQPVTPAPLRRRSDAATPRATSTSRPPRAISRGPSKKYTLWPWFAPLAFLRGDRFERLARLALLSLTIRAARSRRSRRLGPPGLACPLR